MKRSLLRLSLAVILFGAAGSGFGEETDAPVLNKAVFAGGSFWCMQPPFDKTTGVTSTLVGYAGGSESNPTYKQVSAGKTGHRESIEVTYDPAKVSYEKLLDIFWHNINPIQTDGQFHDIGDQYTSAIFYGTEAEKALAESSKQKLVQSGKFKKPIATVILPVSKFWPAEEYHQKYYVKNPLAYRFYRYGSGRDAYLQKTWGTAH